LANLGGDEILEEAAADQGLKGKGKEVDEGAGGDGIVGDEDMMKV